MIKYIKNSKGYISIENIIVSGLVIGVGIMAFMAYQVRSNQTVENSLSLLEKTQNDALIQNPF